MSPFARIGSKLVENGYHAITIMPGAKRPGSYQIGEWHGSNDWQRYCDRAPTEIELEIWNEWPDAGVGIALDKSLKVIDVDTDNVDMTAAILAVIPAATVKKRGKKGFSAFYRGSEAIVSQSFSVGKDRVVDLLCHGRQTVLPPTLHPDTGQPYIWLTLDTLEGVAISELPQLPDNIADQIADSLKPFGYEPAALPVRSVGSGVSYWRDLNDAALANLDAWVPALGLPKTKRRGDGYRAVATWREAVNSNADGNALSIHSDGIKDWSTGDNHTPINLVMLARSCDLEEASQWLAEKVGFEPATDGFDVGAFVARVTAPEPANDNEGAIDPPQAIVDPFDVSAQGGILQLVTQHILDTARVPVPEFATIASLAFLSAFYGRRYVTPTELGLNTYLVGIAGPGFGKDHPRAAVEMLLHHSSVEWLAGPNDVTSDSAIEKIIRTRPCFVMPWDEVGVLFQGMNDKNAAWTRSIRKSLLELYSRSTRVWTGKEKADKQQHSTAEPVWFPTVSVLGFSTPTEFYKGITEQNMSDGFMARFTIIEATGAPKRTKGRSILKAPTELMEKLKAAYSSVPPESGNLLNAAAREGKQRPAMHVCLFGVGAEARVDQIEEWQLGVIERKPEYEGVVGRAAEQTQKLATLRAISRNSQRPVVELDDVEWGYAIVRRSIVTIDRGVRKHMSGSAFEALCKLLRGHVDDAGPRGIAESVLKRKRGVMAAGRDYDGAIKYLLTSDQIKLAGDKGRKYVAA